MKQKRLTPLKAIRAKCLDCCCWHPSEVRKCPAEDCPLYCYRLGKNPNRKGIGSKKGLNLSKITTQDKFLAERNKISIKGKTKQFKTDLGGKNGQRD